MDRTAWKQERRLWNTVQMDTIYARQYDERWGSYINPSHQQMVERLFALCPLGSRILDAACGTGKYWSLLQEHGYAIQGSDQSQRMIEHAQRKFPGVPVEHIGLQELAFVDQFDAIICVDAMENLFPEDWSLVLTNFAHALRQHGYLYFTVEEESEAELQIAYAAGQRLGLPLVYGEYAHHGGYHYYPTDEQVRAWIAEAGFTLLDMTEGDDYRHYLTRT